MYFHSYAATDYQICFEELFLYVDYFVVNVSSPNTPGLRALQEKEPLLKLLNSLQNLNDELALKKSLSRKPILLKIAPDLTTEQLECGNVRFLGTVGPDPLTSEAP